MGRHGDRKRQNTHSKRSNTSGYGVADALHHVKRRRLSEDDLKDDSHQRGNGASSNEATNDNGWQTVPSRSSKYNQKRRRDSNDAKKGYPSLSFVHKSNRPILIEDLRDLALYVLTDGVAPTWVAVNNSRAFSKVVITMVPGLDDVALKRAGELLDSLRTMSTKQQVLEQVKHESVNGDQPRQIEKRQREQDMATKGHFSDSNSRRQVDPTNQASEQHKEDRITKDESVDDDSTYRADTVDITWDGTEDFLDLVPLYHNDWLFDNTIPVKAPGDSKYNKVHSPLQAVLMTPEVPDKTNTKSRPENQFKSAPTSVTQFIHSSDELREAEYPIHPATFTSAVDAALEASRRESTDQSKAAGWVDSNVSGSNPCIPPSSLTNPHDQITQGLDIYAIDCEMVLTSDQKSSLARISIVSWRTGRAVLDKYVKPDLPIENYFTQYSGITPQILENVTTKLSDVQEELLKILTPSTILLGHSLESDLNALKMTHPFIIDTSMLYPHPRGLPLRSSLKFLANKHLKREIQMGGAKGHDSVEDACAVLDLVKLKCEKGPKFGTPDANGEPIFRRISKYNERSGKSLTSAIVEYGSSPERGLGKDASHAIGCQNDDEIVAGMVRAIKGDVDGKEILAGGASFVWGRLRALEFARGWVTNNNANSNASSTDPSATVEDNNASELPQDEIDKTILKTLRRIAEIRSALPPTTLFVLYSGTSDVRPASKLQAMQSQYRKEFKVKKWDELTVRWTDAEEQALRNAVYKARQGWGWVGVK